MRMRRAIGLSFALLAISGIALAKQTFAAEDHEQQSPTVKAKTAKTDHPSAQSASGHERKQGAEARHTAVPHSGAPASSREDRGSAPLKSAHEDPLSSSSKKPTREDRFSGALQKPTHEDRLSGSSQNPAAIKVVGLQEIGMAAWYGGHHLGQRTASGALLDSVTPTAAHRSLPLNSLVRITNLRNGRSVICKVNDRGPWGHNRLIDLSPRAADELDMKRSGIAKVSVEPLASTAQASLH
jgi:rare lipoprotein A (peptidoglycan hydrolase)